MTTWIDTSIMARHGVAKARAGRHHTLTEAEQGRYCYVYGAYADPVLEIEPGDTITVETLDAFGGAIKTEHDLPSKVLTPPYVNPQNGPILVKGAEPGDTLAVHISSVTPRGPQPRGTTCLIPEFGGLTGTANTAMLTDPLPETVRKVHVDESGIVWSDKITLPYEPFIGTIGVAPRLEAISSLQPDYYGGNMDLPDVAPNTIIYFGVNHPGAYLHLGDCHAAQGDGELCGVAIEQPTTTTLQVDLIKGRALSWPRIESETMVMSVGSARPLEDATRIAYRDLIHWMVADYGFETLEAYMLLTQCGRVRLGNLVDPKYTVGASVAKSIIA